MTVEGTGAATRAAARASARTATGATTGLTTGVAMVLVSIVAMQGGQATAKLTFALAPPVVITALRFGLGTPLLWLYRRPRMPKDRRALLSIALLGTALAGVNITVYQSFARLPVGVAVTLQFLGALVVSLLGARRPRHVVWAASAAGGVFLINYAPAGGPSGELSTAGIVFALASAVCWAAYMLIGAHVGRRYPGGDILASATLWAALLTVPVAVVEQPKAFLDPRVLGAGLAVAVLSTVVANSLELASLQRISAGTFGILVSLEPVAAAFVGLFLLDQHLTWAQWLATLLIVAASIGMTADQHRRGSRPSRRRQPGGEGGRGEGQRRGEDGSKSKSEEWSGRGLR